MFSAIAAGALATSPAAAQLGVDLDTDAGVSIGSPYRNRGYESGRWYYYDDRGRSLDVRKLRVVARDD